MTATLEIDRSDTSRMTFTLPAPTAGKWWNTCSICGKSWSGTSPSNDCGANDAAHRKARGQ